MTEHKHTPGPWFVPDQTWARSLTVNVSRKEGDLLIPCPGSGGAMSYTDEVCTLSWVNTEEWDANARLISAAPDMLEALKGLLEATDLSAGEVNMQPLQQAAYDAIAKAEGIYSNDT